MRCKATHECATCATCATRLDARKLSFFNLKTMIKSYSILKELIKKLKMKIFILSIFKITICFIARGYLRYSSLTKLSSSSKNLTSKSLELNKNFVLRI